MRVVLPNRRIAVLLLCLGLVACFVAGCGGHSKAPSPSSTSTVSSAQSSGVSASKLVYEEKMQRLGKSLGAILSGVGAYDQTVISNTASEKNAALLIVKELRMAQVKLRAAAGTLAAIHPPAPVKASHEKLRNGVLEYATELNQIIRLVRTGNFAALQSIATLTGVKDMEAASAAITRKGYVIL